MRAIHFLNDGNEILFPVRNVPAGDIIICMTRMEI